jgi:hypothetical protein
MLEGGGIPEKKGPKVKRDELLKSVSQLWAKKQWLQIYGKISLLRFYGTNLVGFCEKNGYNQAHFMIS